MDPVKLDLSQLTPKNKMKQTMQEKTDLIHHSPSFESILSQSFVNVNNLQQESDMMVQKLAVGEVDDISTVVLSVQRAELALRMITEVRNKLVDAYQQLARMPV
ncbi:MAG: flagellar hook-basal body complex protein FliE [Aminobacterium sp.]|jgi:flagellar hook-basal body complex protein FliE|uniref:Flagellar hook-basal body complex protein FliE n=1 Tax=bioreactor metagenome TaxID=1076179 RepID=A0A645HE67_9ZZZZ|nr:MULTISPECIES: flagellar hook-basal body complex protein FliE [unclassified Aminobacterium]MDD2207061.1 flagellar hook-basal body complex protein FliE [Aminobacterium sp.]MDD3425589.1 flagellar hook-basal body complex protein FliE [Aminobacterium sp.]MDD3707422.1 flagellar hook-basal body complex protein FliE [Aminobacterium sp.]MDD4228764.1 flagellar hook-basal body complex protein FliE [Aminobacterium sp.]MDD4550617.1 flagellar hook-basal body complex protein FliE [Aminobacterium sp.]